MIQRVDLFIDDVGGKRAKANQVVRIDRTLARNSATSYAVVSVLFVVSRGWFICCLFRSSAPGMRSMFDNSADGDEKPQLSFDDTIDNRCVNVEII